MVPLVPVVVLVVPRRPLSVVAPLLVGVDRWPTLLNPVRSWVDPMSRVVVVCSDMCSLLIMSCVRRLVLFMSFSVVETSLSVACRDVEGRPSADSLLKANLAAHFYPSLRTFTVSQGLGMFGLYVLYKWSSIA